MLDCINYHFFIVVAIGSHKTSLGVLLLIFCSN